MQEILHSLQFPFLPVLFLPVPRKETN